MNSNSKIKHLVLAALFTTLTAIGAFIKIPFYPVPFTLQSLFPVLAGVYLAPRYAITSQVAYLILGLAGLPVFASGGGIGYVLQPTFGYLLMLPVAAGMVALLYKKSDAVLKTWLKVTFGLVLILLGGAIWLYLNLTIMVQQEISFSQVVFTGFIIFLPSMFIKSIVISLLSIKLVPQTR